MYTTTVITFHNENIYVRHGYCLTQSCQTTWLHVKSREEYEPRLYYQSTVDTECNATGQAPVVRKVDNAIHWINHYPVDSMVCFVNTYPLDSDLSVG